MLIGGETRTLGVTTGEGRGGEGKGRVGVWREVK